MNVIHVGGREEQSKSKSTQKGIIDLLAVDSFILIVLIAVREYFSRKDFVGW